MREKKMREKKMNPESETFFGSSYLPFNHLLFYFLRLRSKAALGSLWPKSGLAFPRIVVYCPDRS